VTRSFAERAASVKVAQGQKKDVQIGRIGWLSYRENSYSHGVKTRSIRYGYGTCDMNGRILAVQERKPEPQLPLGFGAQNKFGFCVFLLPAPQKDRQP